MPDRPLVLETLRASDIGRNLRDEDLERIAALGQLQTLDQGEVILRQLAPTQHIFLPCSGTVIVERSALNGCRQVIGFLRQGDYLGFTATTQYHYSASSLEPCTLLKIRRREFSALCDELSELKANVAYINNTVLSKLLDHLFAIGQKRAHARLAFLLHQIHRRDGSPAPGTLLALPMSRTDIGDYLGLTLETTSRAFSRLREDGVITTPDHHSAIIIDLERLEELAEVN